jgi:acetyl-CoA synthetase
MRPAVGAARAHRLSPPDAARIAAARIAASPHAALTEREAKAVLAAYGVPVAQERLAQLGMPVALKLESPDVPHKTEAGVLRLGLASAEQVRTGYA